MDLDAEKALVLFSGGQDSTVALAWALERFPRVETIGFDYGQRHAVELDARRTVRAGIAAIKGTWRARLGPDHQVLLAAFSRANALTGDVPVRKAAGALPTTFVPGRNLLFFLHAAIKAHETGAKYLVGGMCETDFSGYPDCRDDALKALQVALNLGMDARFVIETPLMWIDKAATWRLAEKLGGRAFVDLILEETHTCYLGERGVRHAWGYGCAACPACALRARGYEIFAGG